jgi:hypothetical protein
MLCKFCNSGMQPSSVKTEEASDGTEVWVEGWITYICPACKSVAVETGSEWSDGGERHYRVVAIDWIDERV